MSQPKKNGNYFVLPNEIFNMDLSAGEIALYAFLMRMEDRKTKHLLSVIQNNRKCLENEQKYRHEIRQAVGGKRINLHRANDCGAPRRLDEKRQPDVQNSAD